nr:collagenase [uncultured Glaciecola sp.]
MSHYKESKKLLVAGGIALALSSNIMASEVKPLSYNHSVDYNHFAHDRSAPADFNIRTVTRHTSSKTTKKQVNTRPTNSVGSSAKAMSTGTSDPTVAEAALLSGQELIDYIVSHSSDLFYYDDEWFSGNDNVIAFYTEENMITILDAIAARSAGYNSGNRQGLRQLAYIARAGYYNKFYDDANFNWSDSADTAVLSAIGEFKKIDTLLTDFSNGHGELLFELVNLIDGSNNAAGSIDFYLDVMDTYPQVDNDVIHSFTTVLYGIHFSFFRNIESNEDFKAAASAIDDLVPRFKGLVDRLAYLQTWGNNDGIPAGNYSNTHIDSINELARLMTLPAHFEKAEAAVASILNEYDRLSVPWLKAVAAIIQYSDCDKFDGICRDDIEAEMYELLFPNTFSFDDGALVIRTAISEEAAQELYHAQKEVAAQYKRSKQDLTTVENDPTDVLTMFIYGTQADYSHFQGFLFNLDSNNGGIYIEQWGQFFTYQRTAQESIYTLEELFRHEYVHFLNSRYTIDGMWGEASFYDNERLTWWDEGSAEFFAGSTQSNGVQVRKIMVQDIKNDSDDRLTIADVLSSSYNAGFKFYRYSALFFNFLNDNQPEIITALYKAGKNSDIAGFDSLVAGMSSDSTLQANYDAYLDAQVASINNLLDFNTITVPALDLLTVNNAADIQAVLETKLTDTACSIFATSMNHRFACTGTITGDTVADLDATLDDAIEVLAFNPVNNFKTMNCAYGEVADMTAIYSCEGALRNLGVELPDNLAPNAIAGDDQDAIESDSINLDGSASNDPDGDAITYSWIQTSGTAVINLIDANTASPSFTLADVSSNEKIVFELTVNDGEFDGKDSVSINVTAENEAPVADAGSDIELNEGEQEILDATASYDPEGVSLTYYWEQLSGPTATMVDDTHTTPAITAPDVTGNQNAVFQVTVSDGVNTDTASVTVTFIDGDDANTAPNANAGSARSVNEGSAVNLAGTGTDSQGDALTYTWTQTSGTSVTLTNADTATATFTAPEVSANTALTFELTVSDGSLTTNDSVTITVNNTTTTNGGGPTGNEGAKSSGGGSMGMLSGLLMISLLAFRRKTNSAK